MVRYTTLRTIGRLHVITRDDGGRPFRSHAELARLAIKGGADTIQFRSKSGDLRRMIDEALEVRRLCREHGVTFIVNDRIDLCLAVEADGVHLGQNDMPIGVARRILGSERIIGATVRNKGDLVKAERESANYVGCGPIFHTSTKELPVEPLGLAGLRSVVESATIPVIAIAGINSENVAEVVAAGAYGVAVVGAVAEADDPVAAVGLLRHRIDSAHA